MLVIRENTEKEENYFKKKGWGHGFEKIRRKELEQVLEGKAIAIFNGEYTTWIAMNKPKKEG